MASMVSSVTRRPRQSRTRTLVKTLCYRLLMVAITVTVAWFVVGDLTEAASIGLVANVVKTGTYYAYERLWDRITWRLSSASA